MDIGISIRNMGSQSSREVVAGAALAAETLGFESIWITDHIAIPPDDAEGSGGRYLDTLTTLAWLAGLTTQVKLGSGVLILPYRAALPTAKQVATVQELSGNRLLLGVGIGWMEAEFRALGVDRRARGQISDETLAYLNACFDSDVMAANGQEFLFKPRPPKPPILIGGRAPHALERAVKYGDGWYPISRKPKNLAPAIQTYRELADAKGRSPGTVTASARLPLEDETHTRELLVEYRSLGVDRLVCGFPFDTLENFHKCLEGLKAALT